MRGSTTEATGSAAPAFAFPSNSNFGTQLWYWSNQWDYELPNHIYPLVGAKLVSLDAEQQRGIHRTDYRAWTSSICLLAESAEQRGDGRCRVEVEAERQL